MYFESLKNYPFLETLYLRAHHFNRSELIENPFVYLKSLYNNLLQKRANSTNDYAIEVIGSTHESGQKWLEHANKIAEKIKRTVESRNPIYIGIKPDDLCKICLGGYGIAPHCVVNLGQNDEDYIVMKSVREIIRTISSSNPNFSNLNLSNQVSLADCIEVPYNLYSKKVFKRLLKAKVSSQLVPISHSEMKYINNS